MIPILSATPAPLSAQSYNPGMAETFSWVPMDGAGRPLFAKAVYVVGGGGGGGGDVPQSLLDDVAEIKERVKNNERINGFVIPDYDEIKNFYFSPTNNLSSVEYKKQGVTVAALHFTYTIQPPVSSDALLESVIRVDVP